METQLKTTNFLDQRKKRGRRWMKTLFVVIGGIVLIAAILAVLYQQPLRALLVDAQEGKENILAAEPLLKEEKFSEAHAKIETALKSFHNAEREVQKLRLLKYIPGVARQVKAVENIVNVALQTGKAAATLTEVADRVTQPIQKDGEITFAKISPDEKRSILELVTQAEPDIEGAKADLDLAIYYLNNIPEHGLLPQLGRTIKPIREQLVKTQQSVEALMPAVRVVPGFVGYPAQKTYLFLLQNNNELRPSGGFIGTYGILKLKDGEVQSLHTENIYNLDSQAEAFLKLDPPAPLKKYLQSTQWYLRDGNWSPDFPTSAKQVLTMYDLETRVTNDLDGVIAIDPTFVQSLMKLTGNITVDGVTFTPKNVVDQLQYQVEVAFVHKGLSDAERKDIIGQMSQILFQRLLTLPKNQWGDLLKIYQQSIKERHFQLYLSDSEAEQVVLDQGWGGNLRSTKNDYLLVVDANLASLKTDQALERSIDYSVKRDADALVASLKIHYRNQGAFDWKTTRYRTYTRVYVPQGSTLLTHTGYLENDKLHGAKEGSVDSSEDLGCTVFGGFTSVEPKEERTIELTYRLPKYLADAYNAGTYQLDVQKQAGTISHQLSLDIQAGGRLQSYSPDGNPTVDGSTLRYATDLRQDRVFSVTFHP
ncbi:MAG: DUF4012 domain-containing protein [bacterium]